MVICIGPGQFEPAKHQTVLCSCRIKIVGFLLAYRALGYLDNFMGGLEIVEGLVVIIVASDQVIIRGSCARSHGRSRRADLAECLWLVEVHTMSCGT